MRPLREVTRRDLCALLAEEVDHWATELDWDYAPVSAAIANGLDGHAIAGRALQDGPRTIAYCYWLREDGRAVVGSAFAARDVRGRGLEERLLDAVVDEAISHGGSERVEAQTLFSTTPRADELFQRAGFAGCRRHYLMRPLSEPGPEAPGNGVRLRPFTRSDLPAAAELIYLSHVGTPDAAVNSTYATPERTRTFVESLVLRDGCGRYDAGASLVAEDPAGLLGVALCSRLAPGNGHICQISVSPSRQRQGIGTALMSRALSSLRKDAYRTASLSVTVENKAAYDLYQRLGFRLKKAYGAHAWLRERGPAWV